MNNKSNNSNNNNNNNNNKSSNSNKSKSPKEDHKEGADKKRTGTGFMFSGLGSASSVGDWPAVVAVVVVGGV